MPSFDLSLPFEPPSTLTRQLRDRSQQLLDQLQDAESILIQNEVNTYIPQHEEWLLEWLVEGLVHRATKGSSPVEPSKNPRLSRKSWDLLYQITYSCNQKGNFAAIKSILRKYDILALISQTLSDAVDGLQAQQSISALCDLLDSLFKFVDLILGVSNASAMVSLDNTAKRRRMESLIGQSLRGNPELGPLILGAYLRLLWLLLELNDDRLDSWTRICMAVFKSCVYGSVNAQKISDSVSTHVLYPATLVLSHDKCSEFANSSIATVLQDYIFCAPLEKEDAEKSLQRLLTPLKPKKISDKESSAVCSVIPRILEIGIARKWSLIDFPLNRKGSEAYSSLLFREILRICPQKKQEQNVCSEMLSVLIAAQQTLDESTTNEIMTNATIKSSKPQWATLRRLATLNVGPLLSCLDTLPLKRADSNNSDMWEFLSLSIDGFVRIRSFQTFLSLWKKQLEASLSDSENSLWFDDRLQKLVAHNIESALNSHQVSRVLCELSRSDDDASVIIIDSILRGIIQPSFIEALREMKTGATLYKSLISGMQSGMGAVLWRRWRLLLRLHETWGPSQDDTETKALLAASERITRSLLGKVAAEDAEELQAGFFALQTRFALITSMSDSQEKASEVLKEILSSLEQASPFSQSLSWNGSVHGIKDMATFILAILVVLASKWINLASLSREICILDNLMTKLISEAIALPQQNLGKEITLRQVWQLILGSTWKYENHGYKESLFSCLLDQTDGDKQEHISFLVSTFGILSIDSLSRAQRERLLDRLLDIFLGSQINVLPNEVQLDLAHAISKTLDYPPHNSRLTSEDSLFGLELVYNSSEGLKAVSEGIMSVKIDIGRKVVRHLMPSKSTEQLGTSLDRAAKKGKKVFSKSRDGANIIFINSFAMCFALLVEVWPSLQKEEFSMLRKKAIELRDLIMSNISKILEQYSQEEKPLLGWYLEMLRELVLLDPGKEQFDEIKGQVQTLGNVHKLLAAAIRPDNNSIHTVQQLFRVQSLLVTSVDDCLASVSYITILTELGLVSEYVRESYLGMLCTFSADDFGTIVHEVLKSCRSMGDDKHQQRTLLQVLALTISLPATESNIISQHLSTAFDELLLRLLGTRDLSTYQCILDTTNCLLREKPWMVSQSNFDAMMSMVGAMTSVSSSGPNHANPDDIYIPLCNVLISALQFHRHRLRGRYHLLVSTIQCLLRCLFLPKTAGRRKVEQTIHPHWIESKSSTSKCTSRSGLAFEKLLRMICDPSVSSVKQNKKENSLSSTVVAAKKAVSIHVSHILTEFINLQLQYQMEPEIRSVLSGGLYSMFDTIGADLLKSINSSLDNHGRVLFRGLYEEWGRYGKWND